MGRFGVAGKCRKTVTHGGGRRRLRGPDPGSSTGGWPGNFYLHGRPPPSWTARVQWWWPESAPTAET